MTGTGLSLGHDDPRVMGTHGNLNLLALAVPEQVDGDPAADLLRVGGHIFVADVARLWNVSSGTVQALLPYPHTRLRDPVVRTRLIRLLACRPSEAEARTWKANPPTDEQVAVLLALQDIAPEGPA